MIANPPGYDDEKIKFYDVKIGIYKRARNKKPRGALSIEGKCELCTGLIAGLLRYDSERIDMTDEVASIEGLARLHLVHQCPQKESRWFDGAADPAVAKAIQCSPETESAAKALIHRQGGLLKDGHA